MEKHEAYRVSDYIAMQHKRMQAQFWDISLVPKAEAKSPKH